MKMSQHTETGEKVPTAGNGVPAPNQDAPGASEEKGGGREGPCNHPREGSRGGGEKREEVVLGDGKGWRRWGRSGACLCPSGQEQVPPADRGSPTPSTSSSRTQVTSVASSREGSPVVGTWAKSGGVSFAGLVDDDEDGEMMVADPEPAPTEGGPNASGAGKKTTSRPKVVLRKRGCPPTTGEYVGITKAREESLRVQREEGEYLVVKAVNARLTSALSLLGPEEEKRMAHVATADLVTSAKEATETILKVSKISKGLKGTLAKKLNIAVAGIRLVGEELATRAGGATKGAGSLPEPRLAITTRSHGEALVCAEVAKRRNRELVRNSRSSGVNGPTLRRRPPSLPPLPPPVWRRRTLGPGCPLGRRSTSLSRRGGRE